MQREREREREEKHREMNVVEPIYGRALEGRRHARMEIRPRHGAIEQELFSLGRNHRLALEFMLD